MLCPPHRRHQQVKTFGVLARVTFDAEKSQALSKLNAEKMDVVRGADCQTRGKSRRGEMTYTNRTRNLLDTRSKLQSSTENGFRNNEPEMTQDASNARRSDAATQQSLRLEFRFAFHVIV